MVIFADCHNVEGNQGEVGAKPYCSDPIYLHFCAIEFPRTHFQMVFNGYHQVLDFSLVLVIGHT